MAPYEGWPIETSPGELALDAHAWLADRWPGYTPSPANFDSGTVDANARMAAEVRDIAANVPDAIFMRYGELAGILPQQAAYATVTGTVTATDTLGYVMPAGTVLGVRETGDVLYTFASDDDITILPGQSTSPVSAFTATETGSGPNDLGGAAVPMVLVDRTLPWLASAQTVTTVIGGQDPQGTEDFLTDLVTTLRLNRPSPMNADDLADFARRDPAVARATAIDRYIAGTDEQQTVGPHDSTGGTFTLTWNAQTTAAIQWNASAAAVQSALEALSNLAPGDIVVTGGPLPGTAVRVQFTGPQGQSNVAAITSTGTNLTGGTDTVPIATATAGAAPLTDQDKAAAVWVVDAAGLDPGIAARTRILTDLEPVRELGFEFSVQAPGYDTVDVTFEADTYPGWDVADVQARAIEAVQQYLSPAQWGIPQPAFGDPSSGAPWNQDTLVRLSEIVSVLNNVDGLWRTTGPGANGMPEINGSSADYTLTGHGYQPVVLPVAGTVTGTLSAP